MDKQCGACGSPMNFKSGTNKSGKAWAGNFCQNKDCGNVEWQRATSQRKTPQNADLGAINAKLEKDKAEILGAMRKVYAKVEEVEKLVKHYGNKQSSTSDSRNSISGQADGFDQEYSDRES